MRIGIDGRALMGKRAGTGRYVFELCKALDKQLPHATFYVYSQTSVEMPVLSDRWIARVESKAWASKLKSVLWHKTRAGILCADDKIEAYWASATFIPSLQPGTHVVSTVYDLAYRLVPDTMKTVTYWAYRMFFVRDVMRANKILAISQGTADRTQQFLGRKIDGIVLPAVSTLFHPQPLEVVDEILNRLGVSRPYLLAVGTLEPRKNLELLIEVYAHLKSKGNLSQYQLVLAGGKGWKDNKLQDLLAQHTEASIIPLGYVSESDLPGLYTGAEAFVFPSRYEGFGIPVLEARACGARVIASDIPEVREAGGEGPLYVDPTAESLKKALVQPLASPVKAISLPSWEEGARVLAQALTSRNADK